MAAECRTLGTRLPPSLWCRHRAAMHGKIFFRKNIFRAPAKPQEAHGAARLRCTHRHTDTDTDTDTHAHTHRDTERHRETHRDTNTHINTHVHIYSCFTDAYIHTFIHTYIHTHTHTHTHIHTHTHTHACMHTYIHTHVKGALFVWKKSPTCQKSPICIAKEPYLYGKRALLVLALKIRPLSKQNRPPYVWQTSPCSMEKRPIYKAKETCEACHSAAAIVAYRLPCQGLQGLQGLKVFSVSGPLLAY